MSSHVIPHRGLDYHLTPTIDTDGRTILDVELDSASWRSPSETATVMEDYFDFGLRDAFWPRHYPARGKLVDEGLATFLYHQYSDEIRAALRREVVDSADDRLAAEAAAK